MKKLLLSVLALGMLQTTWAEGQHEVGFDDDGFELIRELENDEEHVTGETQVWVPVYKPEGVEVEVFALVNSTGRTISPFLVQESQQGQGLTKGLSAANHKAGPQYGFWFKADNNGLITGTTTVVFGLRIVSQPEDMEVEVGENDAYVVYIEDNDEDYLYQVQNKSKEIEAKHHFSYPLPNGGSAEIVDFDAASKQLYVVNSANNALEIYDFSTGDAISLVRTIDMSAYGIGINSLAVKGDVLVAACPRQVGYTGVVVFFDLEGNYVTQVEAGHHPDMVTFTPNGEKVLVANEGEPSALYDFDGEGSITVIDISGGVENLSFTDRTNLGFEELNGTEAKLNQLGVRIPTLGSGVHATVAQDLEPEYITVSADGSMAYVSLQENNSLAVFDIENMMLVDIYPLGAKDFSEFGNGLDASNREENLVNIANWPVKGLYMPDAIASYEVNGKTYVVTANEGDARLRPDGDFGGFDEGEIFSDEVEIGDAFDWDWLDADINGLELLTDNDNLGKLKILSNMGDTDGDGDIDEFYAYGARSFSIWDAETGARVYDSGREFELYTLYSAWGEFFNADNEESDIRDRSDNKGPEPEGVTVATINDQVYAFVTLERTGGVMIYNVTNPMFSYFVQYINHRFSGDDEAMSDYGPEGIIFIEKDNSPTGEALFITANEVSGTLGVFEVMYDNTEDATAVAENGVETISIFPNPTNGSYVFFGAPSTFELRDLSGKVLKASNEASAKVKVSDLAAGIYMISLNGQTAQKVVVQ